MDEKCEESAANKEVKAMATAENLPIISFSGRVRHTEKWPCHCSTKLRGRALPQSDQGAVGRGAPSMWGWKKTVNSILFKFVQPQNLPSLTRHEQMHRIIKIVYLGETNLWQWRLLLLFGRVPETFFGGCFFGMSAFGLLATEVAKNKEKRSKQHNDDAYSIILQHIICGHVLPNDAHWCAVCVGCQLCTACKEPEMYVPCFSKMCLSCKTMQNK